MQTIISHTANTAAQTVRALIARKMAFEGGFYFPKHKTQWWECVFPGRSGPCIGCCLCWAEKRLPLECQSKYPVLSVLCVAVWDPEQPQDQHQGTFSSLGLQTYWTAALHPLPSLTALSCEPVLLLEIKTGRTTACHIWFVCKGWRKHSSLATSAWDFCFLWQYEEINKAVFCSLLLRAIK